MPHNMHGLVVPSAIFHSTLHSCRSVCVCAYAYAYMRARERERAVKRCTVKYAVIESDVPLPSIAGFCFGGAWK